MKGTRQAFHGTTAIALGQPGRRSGAVFPLLLPLAVGVAFDVSSVAIGNPYLVSAIGVLLAISATVAWSRKPLPWVALASVVAANPVNLSASIALNLLFGVTFLISRMKQLRNLPKLPVAATVVTLASALIGLVNWTLEPTLDTAFTQGASIANYVLGPFALVPIIYLRVREESLTESSPKLLVYALALPTVAYLAAARFLGTAVSDPTTARFGSGLTVTVFGLGAVEFTFTRTQVGFVLASVICATFSVIISDLSQRLRVASAACLLGACGLLLWTGSVGSALAAIAGLAAILFVGRRRFSANRYAMILGLGIAVATVAWRALPEGIQEYAESRYDERFGGGRIEGSDRIERWTMALEYLKHNPIGVGWSLFIEPIGAYPHNDYLTYAIAYGLPAGLLYLLVPAWILLSLTAVRVRSLSSNQFAVLLAGVGVTVVLLANSAFDHLTANRWYFNVVWSMIWLAFFTATGPSRGAEPMAAPARG